MKMQLCMLKGSAVWKALVFALLPLLAFGCATTGINKGQINIVSSAEEVGMGKEFSKEIEEQFELLRDAEVTNYVQSVGNRLVRVCDRSDIEYHFAVIKKDDLNAFALPGGYIYIYTGLLKELDDEAQLAGVLGHEIGHVSARHATERLTAMYGYQLLVSLILGKDPNFYANLVTNIFATTGFLAYSRDNEYEADRLGTRYAYTAGNDPDGIAELLQKLSDMQAAEPGKLEELLSTHPPTNERIRRVRSIIAGLPVSGDRTRNENAYSMMKRRLPR
ncbi:MAG: M48 family metalloprotease [Candidatus Krumholzibacteria bacterium]|nr:M48 family metalloprotease [Candidatus Krumholzibacteria bacterium]